MNAPREEGEANGGGAGLFIVLYPFAALAIGRLPFIGAAIASSVEGAELGPLHTVEDAKGVPLEPAEPTATARRTPGVWWGAAWLALLVAWVPPLVAMHVADSSSAAKTGVGAALGTVAVLATLVFGARLGQRSAWKKVWVASFVGAGEIAVAVFCWELLAPTDPESTQNTGGLLVMVFIAAFYAVGGLLLVGAAIGRWLQRVRAAQ